MIASVACDVPDRLGAVALLEDEDDDPEGRAERDEVEDHRLDRRGGPSGRPASAARTSAGSRRRARRGTSRRPHGRSRGPPARRRRGSAVDEPADLGSRAGSTSSLEVRDRAVGRLRCVLGGEGLDQGGVAPCATRRRRGAGDPRRLLEPRRPLVVAPLAARLPSTSTTNGLSHARRRCPPRSSAFRPTTASSVSARQVLRLRLGRVQLHGGGEQKPTITSADRRRSRSAGA